MKIQYDNHADAAYIYIADKITNGSVKKTYACDISETDHMINLDFDNQGRLIGIEVLDASKCLPKEVLRKDFSQSRKGSKGRKGRKVNYIVNNL